MIDHFIGRVLTTVLAATRRLAFRGRVGETFYARKFYQHYGFSSSPLEGADVVVISKGMTVSTVAEEDLRYMPTLLPGEVALYDSRGNYLIFKATGNAVLNLVSGLDVTSVGEITITAPTLQVNGNIDATGTVHGSNV